MYLTFYGLKEKPFSVTPDSSFLFRSRYHSEAFNHLLYGIKSKEGFILITGDIGTGKTTLCRALLSELGGKTHSALIFNPNLTEIELLRAIIQDLGIETLSESKKDLIDGLNRFLLACSERGETVVVIIDEAQNLPPEVLEEIRLLSNLETEKEKLIQLILVGQTELQEKLKLPYLQQLNQRISVRYHLRPLEKDEVERYIHHRLMKAGSHGDICFTSQAIRAIYAHSQGIPRLINLICDKALLAGYIAQKKNISGRMIRDALADLDLESAIPGFNLMWKPGYAIASMLIILFLIILQIKAGKRGFIPTCQIPSRFAEARIPESLLGNNTFGLQSLSGLNGPVQNREGSDGSRESLVTLLKIWGIQEKRLSQELAFWKNDSRSFSFSEKARDFAFEATQFKGTIQRIQKMNYPCIVLLRDKNNISKQYFATLTEFTQEGALIADPWKGTVTIPLTEFESAWTNLVIVLWRNFDGINGELQEGTIHPAVSILKKRLAEIGLLKNYQPDDRFDEHMTDAVKNLQREYSLREDGIVGSLTKMVLYRSLPFLYLPNLKVKGYEPDRKGA